MADNVLEQIAALNDHDWAIREEAAQALGTYGDARAVAPLVRALKDQDGAVRQAATLALTRMGEAAVLPLADRLLDQDLGMQESAASILARIGDVRVVEKLVAALGSPDWIVRMHAARGLGRIGDPRSISPVMRLLQDKVKAVREEAATALVSIGKPAVPVLLEALRHDDWLVRLHAIEALGKVRAPEAVEPLLGLLFTDRDTAVREDTARALGDIGDARAVRFLLVAMKEVGLRPLAIEALGKIGDRQAVPALVAVVTGADRPAESRRVEGCGEAYDAEMLAKGAAVRALGLIRDDATVPTLIEALRDTTVRSEAAAALVRFGERAIPSLLEMVRKEQDGNLLYHIKETLAAVGWRAGRVR